ncbi:uncharacterized protein STEHIDRAFT_167669 [Stereum hirsutum FP-91666 SS1]|uniref:uncharacterized protein n=1 Tax=Stereum hirsutum (strain FP-91666) TaxID=721885 RepID=UPI000440ED42|nr:uncharacterized protein STEHIDRAFT_167669 [Stereum hirsutum FP-91666 SS1]EIM88363.1 hypothetical protein STEHIDRAFT_167669 [Stereum hirsutum FP-91666 SS1]
MAPNVLPGAYGALFLWLEPVSTVAPAFLTWFFPGVRWFHHQLIPSSAPVPSILDARSTMAIFQLVNCYMLLGLLESLGFRAVKDALPDNPKAQERIIGASLFAMAVADVTHIMASFIGLPDDLKYDFASWNPMTHGNISFVVFLLGMRIAWFVGVSRKTYYYGKHATKIEKDSKAS